MHIKKPRVFTPVLQSQGTAVMSSTQMRCSSKRGAGIKAQISSSSLVDTFQLIRVLNQMEPKLFNLPHMAKGESYGNYRH
jgi:hypothetical protein